VTSDKLDVVKRVLLLFFVVLSIAVIACSKKVGSAPGALCSSVSDCGASPSCDEGFCSRTCSADTDCLDTSTAAGPTCTKFTNGTSMCCPTAGCPLSCTIEHDGSQPCKSDNDCCDGDVCAQSAAKGGKYCFTKCSASTQCKTNCCAGAGLTDGSGQLTFGCVVQQAAYTCMH
jgi:hypothetical protein